MEPYCGCLTTLDCEAGEVCREDGGKMLCLKICDPKTGLQCGEGAGHCAADGQCSDKWLACKAGYCTHPLALPVAKFPNNTAAAGWKSDDRCCVRRCDSRYYRCRNSEVGLKLSLF